MKKGFLFYCMLLILLISNTPFRSQSILKQPLELNGSSPVFINNNFKGLSALIPDVMNNVNVAEFDGQNYHNVVYNLDSFPNFTGFPKNFAGTSFEGAIYCNMDADPEPEIVFNVGFTIQALNMDGTSVTGWPVTVPTYALEGAPSFGDIDGDGQGEIVVSNHGLTSGGSIFAYHRNGTAVTGFPLNHGYSSRTPVLADLNNDGRLEIIVNKRSGASEEWVYNGNGSVYTGWPKSINSVPGSSAAVGDIDHDGIPEIIAESYNSLYVWHADGTPMAGFPFTMTNGDNTSYSSPVLVDVDGDNQKEIVFGTHSLSGGGYVYLLKNDGTVMPGWPKTTSQWIYGPPAVGYIDGDNIIDIAIGDQVASGSPLDYAYAWNKNGTALTGFPIGPVFAINDQIILADVNNDNSTDLIFDDNTTSAGAGKYLAYKNDGTLVTGWPITTQGTSFFFTPVLLDINNNGILDIFGGGNISNTTNTYLWNTGANYTPAKIYNPMWQYNPRHNGVYNDLIILGLTPVSSNVPGKFSLKQNYPNPFNPSTKINFDITSAGNVQLKVYNVLGKEVAVPVNENLHPGTYSIDFNAANLSSGIYFYKLTTGSFTETKKMMLIK